jgi:nicotinate-nucleotide--dimethylbenzimidazole phosphoribosyltransferase
MTGMDDRGGPPRDAAPDQEAGTWFDSAPGGVDASTAAGQDDPNDDSGFVALYAPPEGMRPARFGPPARPPAASGQAPEGWSGAQAAPNAQHPQAAHDIPQASPARAHGEQLRPAVPQPQPAIPPQGEAWPADTAAAGVTGDFGARVQPHRQYLRAPAQPHAPAQQSQSTSRQAQQPAQSTQAPSQDQRLPSGMRMPQPHANAAAAALARRTSMVPTDLPAFGGRGPGDATGQPGQATELGSASGGYPVQPAVPAAEWTGGEQPWSEQHRPEQPAPEQPRIEQYRIEQYRIQQPAFERNAEPPAVGLWHAEPATSAPQPEAGTAAPPAPEPSQAPDSAARVAGVPGDGPRLGEFGPAAQNGVPREAGVPSSQAADQFASAVTSEPATAAPVSAAPPLTPAQAPHVSYEQPNTGVRPLYDTAVRAAHDSAVMSFDPASLRPAAGVPGLTPERPAPLPPIPPDAAEATSPRSVAPVRDAAAVPAAAPVAAPNIASPAVVEAEYQRPDPAAEAELSAPVVPPHDAPLPTVPDAEFPPPASLAEPPPHPLHRAPAEYAPADFVAPAGAAAASMPVAAPAANEEPAALRAPAVSAAPTGPAEVPLAGAAVTAVPEDDPGGLVDMDDGDEQEMLVPWSGRAGQRGRREPGADTAAADGPPIDPATIDPATIEPGRGRRKAPPIEPVLLDDADDEQDPGSVASPIGAVGAAAAPHAAVPTAAPAEVAADENTAAPADQPTATANPTRVTQRGPFQQAADQEVTAAVRPAAASWQTDDDDADDDDGNGWTQPAAARADVTSPTEPDAVPAGPPRVPGARSAEPSADPSDGTPEQSAPTVAPATGRRRLPGQQPGAQPPTSADLPGTRQQPDPGAAQPSDTGDVDLTAAGQPDAARQLAADRDVPNQGPANQGPANQGPVPHGRVRADAPSQDATDQHDAPFDADESGHRAPGYAPADLAVVHRVIRERHDGHTGFLPTEVPDDVLGRVLAAAHAAPSAGFTQPWDFVVVRAPEARAEVHRLAARQWQAQQIGPAGRLAATDGPRDPAIQALLDAPVHVLVTSDPTRTGRHRIGRPDSDHGAAHLAALAVQNLLLAARAEGLGVTWPVFTDAVELASSLGAPPHLRPVAYLCLGYVKEFTDQQPEVPATVDPVVRTARRPLAWVVHEERYGNRALPGGPPVSLLHATVEAISPLDDEAVAQARASQAAVAKPQDALGELERVAEQLAGLAGTCPPPLPEPAVIAVFAADHGVHAQHVTGWPQESTSRFAAALLSGSGLTNPFADQVGAQLRVIDVGLAADLDIKGLLPRRVRAGTADLTTGHAMSEQEAVAALEVGIETARDLVGAGFRCLLTGEVGTAGSTASAALVAVFTGASAAQVTGYGMGVDEQTYAHKVETVAKALRAHQPDPADPIGVLARVGGLEHAALAGLVLGAAALRVPVVLDGVTSASAALVAQAIAPASVAACVAGHRSSEPGHALALAALGLSPLIDVEMRLGGGVGAALTLPLVQASARVLSDVATFDELGLPVGVPTMTRHQDRIDEP